jgi:2-haloacid dehalogenase
VQTKCVLFDLNGTLLDPGDMAEALDEAILLSMAETLAGSYRPFPELLQAALGRRGESEAFGPMPSYPDAAIAIVRVREAGLRPCVLTNSPTEAAEAALERAGLAVDLVVGSDQVKAYKPDPRVYRRGLEAAGVEPTEACMVSAHGWDLMGAGLVGMRTAWVARKEGALPETVPEPDVRADTLEDTAARLVEVAHV